MLHFVMRWGKLIATCLTVVVAAAGVWAAVTGGNWLWALVGFGIAGIGYGLALSYVELVKLITDMLLPK